MKEYRDMESMGFTNYEVGRLEGRAKDATGVERV